MPNNFTYNNGVPDGPDNPSDDQPDMKINTQSIESIIAVDHISFNTNGGGIHKQVTLLNQNAPGLGDGNGVLYANVVNGESWPIWQNNLGSTTLMSSATNNGTNGYTSLPGGMLIQWGLVAAPGISGAVVFPTPFLAATPPFTIQLTMQRTLAVIGLVGVDNATPPTNSGFNYVASIGSDILYWMAIGRKV